MIQLEKIRRAARPVRTRTVGTIAFLAFIGLAAAACTDVYGPRNRDLEIIWPRNGATLVDEEVLSVRLRGYRLEEYEVYWYIDDSREWRMHDDWYSRPERKTYTVDTWYWDWRGRGPYTLGFIAEDRRGRQIAHRTIRVYVR